MVEMKNELDDPSVAALAAALCIFAARGRAIREEREKQHNLHVTQSDTSLSPIADSKQVITSSENLAQGWPGG